MSTLPNLPETRCAEQLRIAAVAYREFVQAHAAAFQRQRRIPRSAQAGLTGLVTLDDWTSGFPAGCLWLLYEHTQANDDLYLAREWTEALFDQRLNTSTHDIGFMINNSFGAGYRLTRTPSYRQVVIDAAHSLASRYNSAVGATRSWGFGQWSFPVIIDNMMNLELLWHASELTGDSSFAAMAMQHALTTQRDHFRRDQSSYHLVDYDPLTGCVLRRQTHQGVHDESVWARGQAWGLYGFTLAFRNTQDTRFLAQAEAIADFYVDHPNMPDDGVPYFDFVVAERADLPKQRDASAAAIATSALLELARYSEAPRAQHFRQFAFATLESLSGVGYFAADPQSCQFLLSHSVGSFPEGHEVDVSLNYADYYYLEALLRGSRQPA